MARQGCREFPGVGVVIRVNGPVMRLDCQDRVEIATKTAEQKKY